MGKPRGALTGRVVSTQGRRVVVRDEAGDDRVCFLSGQRAVIGDRVRLVASGPGEGKLTEVMPRERALIRVDFKGREQEIAAWLGGLVVVAAADQPAYRAGLVDRYLIGASAAGLGVILLLTKIDLGVSDEVERDLLAREALGYTVARVSTTTGEGMEALRAALVARGAPGPWALVGHSGVGKTSVIRALLPDVDVGPVGEISEFWEAGRHTTTHSRVFDLGDGVEIADSPGIRTFLPGGLGPETVRAHFPGLEDVVCRYRDCLHRPGEEGCAAEGSVEPALLERYRRVLTEVESVTERQRSW
ncbi:MAG TPA: ribosome small subunit-dependent GTPase A [Myxococcota bacterium]|nr:ribosome small subunit-dependent GTPase A [Myxococcota bacterium]